MTDMRAKANITRQTEIFSCNTLETHFNAIILRILPNYIAYALLIYTAHSHNYNKTHTIILALKYTHTNTTCSRSTIQLYLAHTKTKTHQNSPKLSPKLRLNKLAAQTTNTERERLQCPMLEHIF